MKLDLKSLAGEFISSVEKKDFSWIFRLSGGGIIVTEQSWRFVGSGGIIVTSDDHDQQFGLSEPMDATSRLTASLRSDVVTRIRHDTQTGDLFLNFSDERYIQFLQMSCGYESWRIQLHDREFICMGGGEYTSLQREQSS